MPPRHPQYPADRPRPGSAIPSTSRRQFLALGGIVAAASYGLLAARPAAGAPSSDAYSAGIRGSVPLTPFPWALAANGRWQARAGDDAVDDRARRQAFRSLVRCGARVIHVAGTGDDDAPGTVTRPLRQISAAVAQARPGDLISVGDGEYGYTEVRDFAGRPDAWLGIMSASADARPTIHVPPPTDNFVNVIGSSYVGLYGFEVYGDLDNPNTNGSGISVYGNSHHVAIWNNTVHDFPGGGVNCFDVDGSHDLVDISYNRIYRTSRYSPSNTSGISIYASRDLTGGQEFPDGYGYRIVGNYIHDVQCLVPFTPGGYDFVTDGNGISLDSVQTTHDYTKPILAAGNVITGCGGRGILTYETVNVRAVQNVAAGNLRTHSPAIDGGVELEGKTDRSVQHLQNVILPTHTPNSTDRRSTYRGNVILGGTQRVPVDNIDLRRLGVRYFRGPLSTTGLVSGTSLAAFTRSS